MPDSDEDIMVVDEDGFEGGEDEIEDMDEEGEAEVEEPGSGKDVAPEDPEAKANEEAVGDKK